jgi:hypothetical protein
MKKLFFVALSVLSFNFALADELSGVVESFSNGTLKVRTLDGKVFTFYVQKITDLPVSFNKSKGKEEVNFLSPGSFVKVFYNPKTLKVEKLLIEEVPR